MSGITYSIFTKPWKYTIPELAAHVRSLGFSAIELPVRPGYPIPPEQVRDLPATAQQLAELGVTIASVAGPADEPTIEACGAAGVPTIRICVGVGDDGYLSSIDRHRRRFATLLPALERCGVRIGVQNHCGRDIAHALGLRALLEIFDPRQVAAVWDAAHNALNGEEPELAIDIVWPHLCMVNLKNAYWQRVNGPEAEYARWQHHWTTGRHGIASWPRVAAELKRRGYTGVVCLTAEYSDQASVDRLVREDLAFAQSLFDGFSA